MADCTKKYVFVGASQRGIDMFIRPMINHYANYCTPLGIYDANIGRSNLVNREFGIKVFEDFEEMINQTKPDYVIVTTVDAFHSDYIIKSMEMGCDVITEKPMTIDAKRCNEILEAEKRTKRNVKVTFNYRYAPFMTQIKQLIMDGEIGDVFSVHFEWLLDRNMDVKAHGTSYFRRWNARMKNSGGLLVHKSTHHFDLVNWWINQLPVSVVANGVLNLYGEQGSKKYANGIKGENCRRCEYADKCIFKYDMNQREIELFAENEKYDGYFKDGCVYADDIDIYDTMSVMVKYSGGAIMSYSLNATCMYEGWRVSINGSKGRIEAFLPESGPDSDEAFNTIKLYDTFNNVKEYKIPHSSSDSHNGGDERLQYNLFIGDKPDPLGLCAGTRDGAASIIIGAAANISIKENKIVNIDELVKFS